MADPGFPKQGRPTPKMKDIDQEGERFLGAPLDLPMPTPPVAEGEGGAGWQMAVTYNLARVPRKLHRNDN